ncbi:MAG: hypothetical protein GY708_08300 [Actinomycetia bacterium]|nr:hypothetical protein [Actinomycetes bacterium]MCP4960195.1 hypothetical protein [Actinomycetes bacterium]
MGSTLNKVATVVVGATLALGACASDDVSPTAVETRDETAATIAQATDDAAAPIDIPGAGDDDEPAGLARAEPEAAPADTEADGESGEPTSNDGVAVIGDVSDDGVLAAAVIIMSDGDLEGAIADGVVTEAEAEAALVAIESGTLGQYAD